MCDRNTSFVSNSFLLLVTTSKALVTSSDALVSNSFFVCLMVYGIGHCEEKHEGFWLLIGAHDFYRRYGTS